MKRLLMLLAMLTILTSLATADFTPNGNINLRDFYNITNGVNASFVKVASTNFCNATTCYTVTDFLSGGGGGSGDITGVQGDGVYIYNGSNSGAVNLAFNETKLNSTIDLRDSDTTYSNGTGLGLRSNIFSILLGYQMPQGCSDGEIAEYNTTSGGWDCAVDNTASSGMASWVLAALGVGGSESITDGETVTFGSGNSYIDVSRSTNNINYTLNDTVLNATIDARDSDTTYTNGSGIDLTGTTFSILYGTSLLGWTNLTNYPTACTSSQTITGIADTITCTAISITASQVSDFSSSVVTVINGFFDQDLNTTSSVVFQKVNASDWTNVTITESQISDLSHTTDTNASTACSGSTTYLDGEGNCDDISGVYVDVSGDTMTGNLNMSTNNITSSGSGHIYTNGSCVKIVGATAVLEVC